MSCCSVGQGKAGECPLTGRRKRGGGEEEEEEEEREEKRGGRRRRREEKRKKEEDEEEEEERRGKRREEEEEKGGGRRKRGGEEEEEEEGGEGKRRMRRRRKTREEEETITIGGSKPSLLALSSSVNVMQFNPTVPNGIIRAYNVKLFPSTTLQCPVVHNLQPSTQYSFVEAACTTAGCHDWWCCHVTTLDSDPPVHCDSNLLSMRRTALLGDPLILSRGH
eukprot:Em0003g671a